MQARRVAENKGSPESSAGCGPDNLQTVAAMVTLEVHVDGSVRTASREDMTVPCMTAV
jgi:hypothetical protein